MEAYLISIHYPNLMTYEVMTDLIIYRWIIGSILRYVHTSMLLLL